MQRMGMESLFYAESLDHSGFFSRTKAEMVCIALHEYQRGINIDLHLYQGGDRMIKDNICN